MNHQIGYSQQINGIAIFTMGTGWCVTAANNLSMRSAAVYAHKTEASKLVVSIFQHIERDSYKDYFVVSHGGHHYSYWGKIGASHASLEVTGDSLEKTFNSRANNGYTFIGTAIIAPDPQTIAEIIATLHAVQPTPQPAQSSVTPPQVVAPQPSRPCPNRRGKATRGKSTLPRTQAGFDVLRDHPNTTRRTPAPRPTPKPAPEPEPTPFIYRDEADENIL
jgi:hypothetical protein